MKQTGKIQGELKSLFSADADPLRDFKPSGPFGISVMAIVGPKGGAGEESFDFMLCTPEWFSENVLGGDEDLALGRHYLFVRAFDYSRLENFVRALCEQAVGASWSEVAQKLGRFGKWEFEDYRP